MINTLIPSVFGLKRIVIKVEKRITEPSLVVNAEGLFCDLKRDGINEVQ